MADGVNLRMQGAIKFALEEVSKIRPLDPVTFVAEKLLEYDQREEQREAEERRAMLEMEMGPQAPDVVVLYRGNELHESDLNDLLRVLARGEVPEDMDDAEMDAVAALVDVLSVLQDHEFSQLAEHTLRSLFSEMDPAVVSTLAQVALNEGFDMLIPFQLLEMAIENSDAAGDDVRQICATVMATQISEGHTPYREQLRAHAFANSEFYGVFNECYVMHDHEWFVENAVEILTDDPTTLIPNLTRSCPSLSRGELLQTRRELIPKFPEEVVEHLKDYFDSMSDREMFAERGDGVRWLDGADYQPSPRGEEEPQEAQAPEPQEAEAEPAEAAPAEAAPEEA